uniref:Uncharacterized protein n=1 Tax=Oryza glumipatula TaxID=40148 RepID=A0A0E0BHN5_9ORYZ
MKTDRIYQMSPSHSSFTGTTTTAKSRWASPSSVAGLLIATTSGVPLVVSTTCSPIFHFIFINGGDDNTASIDLRSLCITASVAATAPPQQSKEQRGGCTTVRRYDSSLPMWKKNVEAPN